jgi:thiosulfate dehydrogenase [quinone] large subunit
VQRYSVEDPPITRLLFSDTRLARLWLPLRLYLGYAWVSSGWGKLENPAGINIGEALREFWTNAVQVEPRPVIAVGWHREVIQFMLEQCWYTWFAKLIAFGELAVGVALILGAFTGLAAFTGGFLNWTFITAGTASTNALLFAIATGLVLAWKTAGWIGLDRWLPPALGTPWRPERLFEEPAPTGLPTHGTTMTTAGAGSTSARARPRTGRTH